MSIEDSLRYKSLSYPVGNVIHRILERQLVIYAEFKDPKYWTCDEQSAFIESIMLGIPTQPIWCEETTAGQFVVVDGSERLRAIHEFMRGDFRLKRLKINKEYNGAAVGSLPYHAILGIEDRYPLPFIVIDYDAAPVLKCEFFRRLNRNDKRVRTQSARNFAYRNALDFLRKLRQQSDPYLNFMSRNGKHAMNSQIDEVFLVLMLFLSMRDPDLRSYIGEAETVEDALDRIMAALDSSSTLLHGQQRRLLTHLDAICRRYSKPIIIEFGSSLGNSEHFLLNEFYQYFLRAMSGKSGVLTKPQFQFSAVSSSRPLQSLIKDANRIIDAE